MKKGNLEKKINKNGSITEYEKVEPKETKKETKDKKQKKSEYKFFDKIGE